MAITEKRSLNSTSKKVVLLNGTSNNQPIMITYSRTPLNRSQTLAPKIGNSSASSATSSSGSSSGSMSPEPINMCEQYLVSDNMSMSGDDASFSGEYDSHNQTSCEEKPKRKRQRLDHLSQEEKIMRRKMKNRMAAQHARDRKKVKMLDLEVEVKKLSKENEAHLKRARYLEEQVRGLTEENSRLHERIDELERKANNESEKRTKTDEIKVKEEDAFVEVDQWLTNEMNNANRSSGTFESAELISVSQQQMQVLLKLLTLLSNLIPTDPTHPIFSQIKFKTWVKKSITFLKSSFPESWPIASMGAIISATRGCSSSTACSTRPGQSILARHKPLLVTLTPSSSSNTTTTRSSIPHSKAHSMPIKKQFSLQTPKPPPPTLAISSS